MTFKDAFQVIKSVYNSTSNALQMVAVPQVEQDEIWDEVDAAADHTSSAIDVTNASTIGILVTWADLDDTDAEVQVEGSIDGTNWFLEGSAEVLATASGSHMFKISSNYL